MRSRALLALALACAFGGSLVGRARAEPGRIMPLERLPPEKLIALAPLLKHGEMALVESNPDGTMKQVTMMLHVAARPETVHDILARPGDYKKFVRNLSKSTWTKGDGGIMQSAWQLELPLTEFDGVNVYDFEPGAAAPINLHAIDPNDDSTYRWEIYGVGDGSVLVQYGYTDVKHSNELIRSFLKRQPTMEHGLAMVAQLIVCEAVKHEAEKRTAPGALGKGDAPKSPGFNFLLDRGQVAVLRSLEGDKLGDVSILDKMFASADAITQVIAKPADYARFLPGLDKSHERRREGAEIEYETEMSIPLITWATTWTMRVARNVVDGVGVAGDLRGAHFRWDMQPRGPRETLVIYRANQSLAASTLILRTLFKSEPYLEHGINVAQGLVLMRAVRGRAEGWPGKPK